jgi:hypothetical protein
MIREEGRGKREEGRRKKEEGRGKREEGRRKKEEGRRKKEEGRRKKEEVFCSEIWLRVMCFFPFFTNFFTLYIARLNHSYRFVRVAFS